MRKEFEEKKYDVRLLDKNIYSGQVSKADYLNYLNTIEDSAENAEELKLEEPEVQQEEVQPEVQESQEEVVVQDDNEILL